MSALLWRIILAVIGVTLFSSRTDNTGVPPRVVGIPVAKARVVKQ